MLIIFSFAFNPETQEASVTGNIDPEAALAILQKLVIAQAIQRARQGEGDKKVAKTKRQKDDKR